MFAPFTAKKEFKIGIIVHQTAFLSIYTIKQGWRWMQTAFLTKTDQTLGPPPLMFWTKPTAHTVLMGECGPRLLKWNTQPSAIKVSETAEAKYCLLGTSRGNKTACSFNLCLDSIHEAADKSFSVAQRGPVCPVGQNTKKPTLFHVSVSS